jgi:hypothetical protein
MELESLFPFRYEDATSQTQAMVYRGLHEGPFRLQPEEIIRGQFVPIPRILVRAQKDLFCPDGLAVLTEYLKRAAD